MASKIWLTTYRGFNTNINLKNYACRGSLGVKRNGKPLHAYCAECEPAHDENPYCLVKSTPEQIAAFLEKQNLRLRQANAEPNALTSKPKRGYNMVHRKCAKPIRRQASARVDALSSTTKRVKSKRLDPSVH